MVDVEVRAALAPVIARIEVELGRAEMVETAPDGWEPLYWGFRYLQGREAWAVDGPFIERFQPPLGPGVADRFAFARSVTDEQVAEGQATQERFRTRFNGLLGSNAVMLLPTMPDIAPLVSEPEERLNDYRNRALNILSLSGLSGTPQVSMPVATKDGAPLGLSLIGPAGSDLSLVRLAARLAG
jgi:amidase